MEQQPNNNAIIIGAGVAGLALAIRLSVQGWKVSIYERNEEPGGKLTAFSQDGFFFDKGPSLLTEPQNITSLFTLAGEKPVDYFSYKNCPAGCHYFWDSGEKVTAWADAQRFAEELQVQLQEPSENVRSYLRSSKKLYDSIAVVFLNFSLHKAGTWLHKRTFKALAALKLSYLTKTFHEYNRQSFANEKTVQLFDRYATYNGSDPYKAPAMLSVIAHLEHNEGCFYAKGGMISITVGLVKLAKKLGVQFIYGENVDRIIVSDKKACGIVVDGTTINADKIISNVDVYYTYKNLLQQKDKAERLLKQERSSSALIFYWGIKKSFPELGLHNIFFSRNYKKEFAAIFDEKKLSDDPTVYINISSKEDVSHAPANEENWFVMINVPANASLNWEVLKAQAKKMILEKLSKILGQDIGPLIVTEQVLTPQGIDDVTGSYLGALYGTSSNSAMAAFLRHPNFSKDVANLFFVGGSVHPGGGIPLCLKSAEITASLIGSAP